MLPVAQHESVLDYRVLEERSDRAVSRRGGSCWSSPRATRSSHTRRSPQAPASRSRASTSRRSSLLRAFVEPKPFAARAIDDTATVVVSIGHESTTLLVSGGGACEFTRVFDWGGDTLQDAVARSSTFARRGRDDPPPSLALRPRPPLRSPRRRRTGARRSRPSGCGSPRSPVSSSARSSSTRPSRTHSASARS